MKVNLIALMLLTAGGAALGQTEQAEIRIVVGGKAVTTFHYGTKWDKPFLHPIRTVSGTEISRAYPLGHRAGEKEDHAWHRGIWFGHGDINGIDFWRELGADKTGRLVVRSKPVLKTRGGKAELRADMDLITPDNKNLGMVREEFVFSQSGESNVIDARVTVFANRGIALKMGDTEEGTFAIRLAKEFTEAGRVRLLNSDNLVGAKSIWGKQARWVDYSSTIDGKDCGIVIFDHPGNPKHPTYWHARGYGLNAANPFGEHDFLQDNTKDGSMIIPEGGKMEFRYRVIIHSGYAKAAEIDKLYEAYTGGNK